MLFQNGKFHVLAPGRSYSLYYLFQIAESEVLSKQAHLSILCHIPIKGSYFVFFRQSSPNNGCTPSSEVTELFCRVPSEWFPLSLDLLDLSTSVGFQYGF